MRPRLPHHVQCAGSARAGYSRDSRRAYCFCSSTCQFASPPTGHLLLYTGFRGLVDVARYRFPCRLLDESAQCFPPRCEEALEGIGPQELRIALVIGDDLVDESRRSLTLPLDGPAVDARRVACGVDGRGPRQERHVADALLLFPRNVVLVAPGRGEDVVDVHPELEVVSAVEGLVEDPVLAVVRHQQRVQPLVSGGVAGAEAVEAGFVEVGLLDGAGDDGV